MRATLESRRLFLQGSLALAGLGLLSSCGTPVPPSGTPVPPSGQKIRAPNDDRGCTPELRDKAQREAQSRRENAARTESLTMKQRFLDQARQWESLCR